VGRPQVVPGSSEPAARFAPLAGIRVLDLTVALAGPYATLLLGALGAEVIKVEAPGGSDVARFNPPFSCSRGVHFAGPLHPDDISITMLARHRNKRRITLDLKTDEGVAVFKELTARSDVVVENLRSGAADRLGVGYEALRAVNPRLIYCSLTAFGPDSAHGDTGMDVTVQALSGLMFITGEPGEPPMRVGIPVGDLVAPLFATIAMLSALRQRDTTGQGQHLEASMLDGLTSLVAMEHLDVLTEFGLPIRTGNSLSRMGPFGCYRCADGYISIAAPQDTWCASLFGAMGMPELQTDPRFLTHGDRVINGRQLDSLIESWTSTLPAAEVSDRLRRLSVPHGVVRDPREALEDPATGRSGAVHSLIDARSGRQIGKTGGLPVTFSAGQLADQPAHVTGEDTAAVLAEVLRLPAAEIEQLRERRVI